MLAVRGLVDDVHTLAPLWTQLPFSESRRLGYYGACVSTSDNERQCSHLQISS